MYENVLLICLTATDVVLIGVLLRFFVLRRRAIKLTRRLTTTRRALLQEKQGREQAEEAQAQRQEWSDILFNNTQDMVFIYSVTPAGLPGPFTQVNDVACRLLGHSRERLLTMTPLDIEDRPVATTNLGYTRSELAVMTDEEILERQQITSEARRLVAQILKEKQLLFERTFITRGGRKFPVEISARRFDLHHEPMVMCTAHDITERRKVHRALRESEQRFQEFFAHSPMGFAMYGADRNLINVNQSCLKMFGTPDLLEFGRFDLFDNAYLSGEVRQTLERGETISYEAAVDFDEIRKNGLFVTSRSGKAHFELLIHNMGLDEDYAAKGYLAQVQDISRRRAAETALMQSERQLRQAQKMEAIGTLAGGIAHDFNNILTPIIGYTEMVMRMNQKGDTTNGDYLTEVLKASHRAKDLVNQILTFSRQTDQEGQPIHVTPIAKEVIKQVTATLPSTITIKQVLRAEHDIVLSEPTQLHQIIMNLCTNGCHAMRNTGGILEVSITNFVHRSRQVTEYPNLTPGRYLRMSIQDAGVGMDAATLERIFEPFFTTKPSGEGTGMGLAVVHGIVSALKGSISVESQPGRGAAFHVVLPIVEREVVEETGRVHALARGNECVMFVDDERDIIKMEAHMLTSLGYTPVVAGSAEEAMRLFVMNPHRFDVIITDQVMPGQSGVEMAADMLAIRPDMPIILCTGFSESVSVQEAKQIGVREFLLKPIDMRTLSETIRKVLTKPSR